MSATAGKAKTREQAVDPSTARGRPAAQVPAKTVAAKAPSGAPPAKEPTTTPEREKRSTSTSASTSPRREPSDVAVLMQDPMTRATFLRDLARETEPLEDHDGGDLHREWVMSQYAEAGNLMMGASPRSTPTTKLNGTDTMARTVLDQLDSGEYDPHYAEYLLRGLRDTRVDDVAASKRKRARTKGVPKPYTIGAEAWETDHGQELQHAGTDHGPNYRLVDPSLHDEKTRALGRITTQYHGEAVKELELDGDQHDHIAEVDLSDPDVGYSADTFGWSHEDHLNDGDDEILPPEHVTHDDPLSQLIAMEDELSEGR